MIIPSINVQTFAEVKERTAKVEPYVDWIHLDITDGVFSKHKTWRNPSDLPSFKTKLKVEAHLMAHEPEKNLDQWLVSPIKRIIVHLEAAGNLEAVIQKCREAGIEIGFALSPGTAWEELRPWFGRVDLVQVLTVPPGPSGQGVDWPLMLGKIEHIRKACLKCIIEVDGGINPETAKMALSAGASALVSGAFIFNNADVGRALNELKGLQNEKSVI